REPLGKGMGREPPETAGPLPPGPRDASSRRLLRGSWSGSGPPARRPRRPWNSRRIPAQSGPGVRVIGPGRAGRADACRGAGGLIMAQTTFANFRGIAHKGSMGMSIVFPDVCKAPAAPSPIPIPYPNIGKSSDTSQGPNKVKTDGQMPMVKGAKYMRSMGDEAGTLGGVLSGINMGECEFLLYSFDVKFEGMNVCRMGDPLWHNKKN